MALIKYSAVVAGASGKVGGTVFSNNKGGAYVRSWVKPTNPNSPGQANVRGLFGTIATQWRELTANQRQTFIDNAKNYPYSNRLGEVKTYTGSQLYQKLNLVLLNAGLPAIVTCPPNPVQLTKCAMLTAQKDWTIQEDGTVTLAQVEIEVYDAAIKPEDKFNLYIGVQGSVGRDSTRTRMRYAGTFGAADFTLEGGVARLTVTSNVDVTKGLGPSIYNNDSKLAVSMKLFNDSEGFAIPIGTALVNIATIPNP